MKYLKEPEVLTLYVHFQPCYLQLLFEMLWYVDPSLGNDRETNN
jgi:hypothetical protein